jgi:hypothetical protein
LRVSIVHLSQLSSVDHFDRPVVAVDL